ncbi:hypothetical protein BH10ACI3_BH10ACI3_00800 [soil metagenome]
MLTPDDTEQSRKFVERFEERFSDKIKLLDDSLSLAAYRAVSPQAPFNLTAEESKRIGAAIGCDVFIMVRSYTQRRSAYRRPEYYESYAPIYVVSSRTGRLLYWKLLSFEDIKPDKSLKMLNEAAAPLAAEIADKIGPAIKAEIAEPLPRTIEEVPDVDSPAAKNFKAPIPFRRIKPEYTTQASLYDVTATVEMTVDLDATGSILRTEVTRWAGFGLDESVEKAVRAMNWRPAERDGKPLPMRFLLRYNFKKLL